MAQEEGSANHPEEHERGEEGDWGVNAPPRRSSHGHKNGEPPFEGSPRLSAVIGATTLVHCDGNVLDVLELAVAGSRAKRIGARLRERDLGFGLLLLRFH